MYIPSYWAAFIAGFSGLFVAVDHRPLSSPPFLPLRGDSAPTWDHIVIVVSVIRREKSCLEGGDRVNDARPHGS
jgi:hypothetical protein